MIMVTGRAGYPPGYLRRPMTVTDITYHRVMGRWEPNARGRLAQAALTLYAERGFEQTTALDKSQA